MAFWEVVVSPVKEFYLDLGLLLFLVGIHRLNVQNWGPIHNVSPFALRVLEYLCWVFRACAHDWHKKQSCLQKKSPEKTLGWRFLDPIQCIARYSCCEWNLGPQKFLTWLLCGRFTTKPTKVGNKRKLPTANATLGRWAQFWYQSVLSRLLV